MKVDKLRTVIIYIIIILLGLVCLLPLLNIVAISLLLLCSSGRQHGRADPGGIQHRSL